MCQVDSLSLVHQVCGYMSNPKQLISQPFIRENADSWASLAVKSEKNKAVYSRSASQINHGARQNVTEDILSLAEYCIKHIWKETGIFCVTAYWTLLTTFFYHN